MGLFEKVKIDINKKGREFNNILCSFDSLFDTDIGCILYILLEYKNNKFIKPEAYYYTDFFIQYQLIHRDYKNPLQVIFKDDYKDQIDNLYAELLDTKMDIITKLSPNTFLATLIKELRTMSGYSIVVEYKNAGQKEKIEDFGLELIEYQTNLDKYFSLILKSPLDIKDRSVISGKTIYFWNASINFADMKTNTKDEIFVDEIIALMAIGNSVRLIDPYQFVNELD